MSNHCDTRLVCDNSSPNPDPDWINQSSFGACSLSTMLSAIESQLKILLKYSVNDNILIDFNKLIVCNYDNWSKYTGLSSDSIESHTVRLTKEYPNETPEQINSRVIKQVNIEKIRHWLIGFDPLSFYWFKSTYFSKKEQHIRIPIICTHLTLERDYESHSFLAPSDETKSLVGCDLETSCSIPVKITSSLSSGLNKNTVRFRDIPKLLCEHGPLMCSFSLTSKEFTDWYVDNRSESNNTFEWDGNNITGWPPTLSDPKYRGPGHAVTLVDWMCFPDNNNPTHYLFKFLDSNNLYSFAEEDWSIRGVWYIKVPLRLCYFDTPWMVGLILCAKSFLTPVVKLDSIKVDLMYSDITEQVEQVNALIGECCDPVSCEEQNTCWKLEFDLEFLSSAAWGMGNTNTWLSYNGNQTLWVDPSYPPDQTKYRRTCNDGVAVDESNPGPPGWEIIVQDAYSAGGNIEAGNCLEGISLYMQSDFATIPGGFNMSPSEGVNTYSIEEDLSGLGENPGSSTQEVIRGTITVTRISPSTKDQCECSTETPTPEP